MHAISTYRGNRPTNTQTQTDKPGHRQDRLQYTAPQLAIARSVKKNDMTNWQLTSCAVVDGGGRAEDEVAADLGHRRRLRGLEVLAAAESLELFAELLGSVARQLRDRVTGHSRHQNDLPPPTSDIFVYRNRN